MKYGCFFPPLSSVTQRLLLLLLLSSVRNKLICIHHPSQAFKVQLSSHTALAVIFSSVNFTETVSFLQHQISSGIYPWTTCQITVCKKYWQRLNRCAKLQQRWSIRNKRYFCDFSLEQVHAATSRLQETDRCSLWPKCSPPLTHAGFKLPNTTRHGWKCFDSAAVDVSHRTNSFPASHT